jgi:hypothetical protein
MMLRCNDFALAHDLVAILGMLKLSRGPTPKAYHPE